MSLRQKRFRNLLVGYGVAILSPVLGSATKLMLAPWTSRDTPFLLYSLVVLLAARVGGLGPGIAATLLSALANQYFFMRPYDSMLLLGGQQQFQVALFVLEGTAISLLCAKLNSARRRAETSEREARELEGQILEISDAEQRRIGHDLHDGLGQHLTGITLMSRRLENRLKVVQPELGVEAGQISALARTAVEWTHDLSRALSPPALERSGLGEALNELASNAQNIFGIQCSVEVSGAVACPISAGVHLYRIAQEAISNAVKHGSASQILIVLSEQSGALALSIEDNGNVGHARATDDLRTGMGLRIMRYRANLIGARFTLTPALPHGTLVRCDYKLPDVRTNHAIG